MNKPSPGRTELPRALSLALLLTVIGASAQSQPSCDSDGQPQPVGLLERFISADCEPCWADAATLRPQRGEVALDWIAPGSKGEDAPLSAAVSRDSPARLRAMGRAAPARAEAVRTRAASSQHKLRVAHGLAFNGYIGASIELTPARGGPWTAWLVLVETLPAGTEGSPVERNLVRNALQPAWGNARPLSKRQQHRFYESRPMSIPEGANPKRLRVVGWVEDSRGRIVAMAQSVCREPR